MTKPKKKQNLGQYDVVVRPATYDDGRMYGAFLTVTGTYEHLEIDLANETTYVIKELRRLQKQYKKQVREET